MAADFLDGAQVGPGLDLLAAEAARQQQAEQAGVVQLRQQWFADALGPLDLGCRRFDRRAQVARTHDGVGTGDDVHAAVLRISIAN